MRTILLRLLLIVASLPLACQGTGSPPPEMVPEPSRDTSHYRLLLNSDGGDGSLYAHEPPISPQQFTRVVDELEGTQVDAFIQCFTHGDHLLYDSAVGEIYGRGVETFEHRSNRRWAHNVFSLLERGLDPLEVLSSRAHELGMDFWGSMRMNDIHKDSTERLASGRYRNWREAGIGDWEHDHPELWIGADVPHHYVRRYGRQFSLALNCAREEVRERRLATIEEICSRYGVDGFELDFLSHLYYFKKGQEQEGMPLMTDFLRKLRRRLDAIAAEKGQSIRLLARVPPSISQCEAVGFDVKTWIREELVDLLAPATRGYLDMSADAASFVDLARGTDCRILGGISDLYVRHYTGSFSGRASIEMMRAAAMVLWEQGVSGLHLFNYDCHVSGHGKPGRLLAPQERQILQEIGDPERIARKNKHYFVTRDMRGNTPEERGEMPLPVDLVEVGDRRQIPLFIGDDLKAARREGLLESILLRVTLRGYSRWDDDLRLELNGQRLDPQHRGQVLSFSPEETLKRGPNQLLILLRGRSPSRQKPVRIQGVELFIDYREASPHDN